MRKSIVSIFAISATIMLTLADNEAMAGKIGVVGLYKTGEQAEAVADDQKVHNLGCQIRREGIIGNEDGDIDINKPNRFVFLACDSSILANPAKRLIFNQIVLKGNTLAVLEGELTDVPVPQNIGVMAERQYILKVSHYNNKDTNGREQELSVLGEAARSLPDTYITESFIGVNRAMGMQTPDEVVMLFYNSPGQGARFRENNDDILDKIGRFNKNHLNDYIYYIGKAVR